MADFSPQQDRPATIPPAPPNAATGAAGSNLGQQLARASWMAPIIAFILGFVTLTVRQENRGAAMIIGGVNALLCLFGFVAGIIALCGMGRWGRRRVLAPAIAGVCIFLFMVGLVVAVLIPALNRARAAATQIQLKQAEQEGRDAATRGGWLGVSNDHGAVLSLMTMPDDSPLVQGFVSNLGTPESVIVLSVDNSAGQTEFTVDTTGAEIYLADGTHQPAPDTVQTLRTARTDREKILQMWSPPFVVPAGKQLVGKFLFLPYHTDPKTLDHIVLKVNGQEQAVPGRYYTEAEKAELFRQGQAVQRQR